VVTLGLILNVSALADEETVEPDANPFLEENLELYEEAMALQGFIVPGVAYLDENEDEEQSRHYSALMDGIILGKSEAITRFPGGHEFSLSAFYDDENNTGVGLRVFTGDYSLRGSFDLADYAIIGYLPERVRTNWIDQRNYSFETSYGEFTGSWLHRESDRRTNETNLRSYTSDRFSFGYDYPACWGDIDFGLSYNRLDSDNPGFLNRDTISVSANTNAPLNNRTNLKAGYAGVWADGPGIEGGGNMSRHIFSGSISRRCERLNNSVVTAYGNYESLGSEQTLNTHYDRRYDIGGRLAYKYDNIRITAGAEAKYFDVDRIRYEMPGIGEFLIHPGLSEDDLAPYTIRNYGYSYSGFIKGKYRFCNDGSLSQELSLSRHYDNQFPDGSVEGGIPAQQPLTLHNRWEWKTGLYTPLGDDWSWQLSNTYRDWDMRVRDSSGSHNLFTTSFTYNPSDDSALSFYYENFCLNYSIEEIDPYAADQSGLGVDFWYDSGNDTAFSAGIFSGKGNSDMNDFDLLRISTSLTLGPDGKWKIQTEYSDSDNSDYAELDFDYFNAMLYYRIDL
jgi:hypothetical protein